MKIYSALYQDPAHLDKFGDVRVVMHPSQLDNPGILIIHGGADISPSIYKAKPIRETMASEHWSARDLSEVNLARRAIELGIPIYGICRGAQLVCALAGGTLFQHVENHIGGRHKVTCSDGKEYYTTTCHHQMMNPFAVEHELLGWTTPLSSVHLTDNGDEKVEIEPELVYFPTIKALAVQGHPEWMSPKDAYVKHLDSIIEEKFL